jgi:uncharacterized coiled-coil protein SlyX
VRDQLEARLQELDQDYAVGERRLRDLDQQQVQLRETLLRIAGAIQVLRELLEAPEHAAEYTLSPEAVVLNSNAPGAASSPEL